jgi:phage protein D
MTASPDTGVPATRLYSARPVFSVDGTAQPALAEAVLSLEVSDDVRGMARFEARFENWGTPPEGGPPDFMFFDGGVVAFGKKLEVTVGPEDAAAQVFSGRITALGGRFGSGVVPELVVQAEDALQFLRMTRRTRTYEDATDADAAQVLAAEHGLTPDADVSGPRYRRLVQLGQSDLAFLRERARLVGAEVWLEGDTLKFKARPDRGAPAVTLTLGNTLRRFQVMADLAHQVTSLHVHGYDAQSRETIDEEATGSLLSGEARGATTGSDILQQAFGARVEHVVDRVIDNSDQATTVAEAEMRRRGRSFVRCRGETEGTATLRVGSAMAIRGVGPAFNGTYVATQVTHRYDRLGGYKTFFEAERPAVGEES